MDSRAAASAREDLPISAMSQTLTTQEPKVDLELFLPAATESYD